MKVLLLFFQIITLSLTLLRISQFQPLPVHLGPQGIGNSFVRNNPKQIFLSTKKNGIAQINRFKVTTSQTIVQTGIYREVIAQPEIYHYNFFIKGYILSCFKTISECSIFNQSSQQNLGKATLSHSFSTGIHVKSKNIFFFGTTTGKIGYFDLNTLPIINPHILHSPNQDQNNVFVSKSNDDKYVCGTEAFGRFLLVYRSQDMFLVKNITLEGHKVTSWSSDNRYITVLPLVLDYGLIFDVENDFALVKRFTIGNHWIVDGFYFKETNSIIALDYLDGVVAVSLDDYTVNSILNQQANYLHLSEDQSIMTLVNIDVGHQTVWFYNVLSYCKQNQSFDSQTKTCIRSKSQSLGFDSVMEFINNEATEALNKVPGGRRLLKPFFAFFFNLDHLWLYIYHKRKYGFYIETLLKTIQKFQEEKWNFVADSIPTTFVEDQKTNLDQFLNYKSYQTSYKFLQVEGQSASYLENSSNYLIFNVPMVVVMFLLFKFINKTLKKFKINNLFTEYAFYGYLVLMLLDGNGQSFTYYFFFDCLHLNQMSFRQRFLNGITVFLFSILIFVLISIYFVFRQNYKENSKHFYDNCQVNFAGTIQLMIKNGMLNFFLGAAHILFQDIYNFQLFSLFFIESMYIMVILYAVERKNVLQYKYIEWINILASLTRIILIFTFYADQNVVNKYEFFDQIQTLIIVIYIVMWILSVLINYSILFTELLRYLKFLIPKYLDKKNDPQFGNNQSKKNLSRKQILFKQYQKNQNSQSKTQQASEVEPILISDKGKLLSSKISIKEEGSQQPKKFFKMKNKVGITIKKRSYQGKKDSKFLVATKPSNIKPTQITNELKQQH